MSKFDRNYRHHYKESIGGLIIGFLGSARSARRLYSLLSENKLRNYRASSIKVAISRLHANGYLTNNHLEWSITKKGRIYAKKFKLMSYTSSPFKTTNKPNTIISFDISTQNNLLRDWLRNQIKIFGYKMLQQSLWIGPGPLPQNFLTRLKLLKISKNIKIFKIKAE